MLTISIKKPESLVENQKFSENSFQNVWNIPRDTPLFPIRMNLTEKVQTICHSPVCSPFSRRIATHFQCTVPSLSAGVLILGNTCNHNPSATCKSTVFFSFFTESNGIEAPRGRKPSVTKLTTGSVDWRPNLCPRPPPPPLTLCKG